VGDLAAPPASINKQKGVKKETERNTREKKTYGRMINNLLHSDLTAARGGGPRARIAMAQKKKKKSTTRKIKNPMGVGPKAKVPCKGDKA